MKDSSMQEWQQEANETLNEIEYLKEELKFSIYEESIEMYMFDISEAETYFIELVDCITAHGGTFERITD